MLQSLEAFLDRIRSGQPVAFRDTMAIIAEYYDYCPIRFRNGIGDDRLVNEPGVNEGSCKIFYFARLHDLSEPETLALFGEYYLDDVLSNPNGEGHRNIRIFMEYGWPGIEFEGEALSVRDVAGAA
jgi:hypothetical protein